MNLFANVHESWIPLIHSLAYKEPLVKFLSDLRNTSYQPTFNKIFKVFEMPVNDVKVVILGHDPYPIPGTAIGTAYAVSKESKPTYLLKKIKREVLDSKEWVSTDPNWQTLEHWTAQGVFLLNTALTVKTGSAGSHIKYWKEFTETVISFLSVENPCIWMLWGDFAKANISRISNPFPVKGYDKESINLIPIDPKINYVIPGEHPMMHMLDNEGFSRDGFFFTNKILQKRSLKQIIW